MASPTVQDLTTTFTPAASCLEDIYQWRTTTFGQPDGEVLKYLSLGPWPPRSCMPTGWAMTSQFYSPGICPAGYTIACLSLAAVGTVTETRATCCPSLYQCQTKTDRPWYSTNRCTVTASMLPSLRATITSIDTIASTTGTFIKSLESFDGINANAVSIRFQMGSFPSNTGIITPTPTILNSKSSSDPSSTSSHLPTFTVPSSVSTLSDSSPSSSSSNSNLISSLTSTGNSTTTTMSSSPLSLSITSRESSSTSSTSPTMSDSTSSASYPASVPLTRTRSGLSSGSKAGMGAGLGVGLLFVIGVAFLLFHRRRNSIQKSPMRSFKYWYGTGPARLGVPVELGVSRSRQWHELDNDRPPVELQGEWGDRIRS